MAGFWFFSCLLVICLTILASVYIVNAQPLLDFWKAKKMLEDIGITLIRIEKKLERENEHDGE